MKTHRTLLQRYPGAEVQLQEAIEASQGSTSQDQHKSKCQEGQLIPIKIPIPKNFYSEANTAVSFTSKLSPNNHDNL